METTKTTKSKLSELEQDYTIYNENIPYNTNVPLTKINNIGAISKIQDRLSKCLLTIPSVNMFTSSLLNCKVSYSPIVVKLLNTKVDVAGINLNINNIFAKCCGYEISNAAFKHTMGNINTLTVLFQGDKFGGSYLIFDNFAISELGIKVINTINDINCMSTYKHAIFIQYGRIVPISFTCFYDDNTASKKLLISRGEFRLW